METPNLVEPVELTYKYYDHDVCNHEIVMLATEQARTWVKCQPEATRSI